MMFYLLTIISYCWLVPKIINIQSLFLLSYPFLLWSARTPPANQLKSTLISSSITLPTSWKFVFWKKKSMNSNSSKNCSFSWKTQSNTNPSDSNLLGNPRIKKECAKTRSPPTKAWPWRVSLLNKKRPSNYSWRESWRGYRPSNSNTPTTSVIFARTSIKTIAPPLPRMKSLCSWPTKKKWRSSTKK